MSAPLSRALPAGCVGALLCVLPCTLRAAPAVSPVAVPAPRPVLLLASNAAELQALVAVQVDLKALVEPTTLRTAEAERHDRSSLLRLANERHALAVIWLDQSSPRSVVVYVFEPASGQLGKRRLPRGSQADAEESVGVVLRATVEALLEGRAAPLEVVALPAEPEVPPALALHAIPKPEARERATLRTGYVGVGFGGGSLEHGAAFGASLALVGTLHVGLDFSIIQPARLRQNQATITLTRRPLDAFAALGTRLFGCELFGQVGTSLDFRGRRSEADVDSLLASPSTSYVVVSILGRLKLARELWPRLRFDVGPALEVPINEPALTIDRAIADETISQWNVRPRLEAGVSLVFR